MRDFLFKEQFSPRGKEKQNNSWVCCCSDMGLTLSLIFILGLFAWWKKQRGELFFKHLKLKKNENFWRFISNVNDEWSGLIIGKWRPLVLLLSTWCPLCSFKCKWLSIVFVQGFQRTTGLVYIRWCWSCWIRGRAPLNTLKKMLY